MLDSLIQSTMQLQVMGGIVAHFNSSNLAGQIIVFLLMAFSMIAWTVMLGKHLELNRQRVLNRRLELMMHQSPSLLDMNLQQLKSIDGPHSRLLVAALTACKQSAPSGQPSEIRIGLVENALQRGVSAETFRYDSRMVLLGSIVTGAPFMGLLGTVWGVMDAFGAISGNSATIQTLAPGVSGALLTTVAGLLVAIPSVFGYNYLLTQTRLLVTELENTASIIADHIELESKAN
jgi:biopolymer transport protein TolQ